MARLRPFVLVVVAAAVLGLGGSFAPAASGPKAMTLGLGALPAGFAIESERHVSNAQAAAESSHASLADFTRWGRIAGYERSFVRDVARGLVRVHASASTYATREGARASLQSSYEAATRPTSAGVRFTRIPLRAAIGDEARVYTATMERGDVKVTAVVVSWRFGTTKASLSGFGAAGTVDPARVIALARAQQRRIEAPVVTA